MLPQLVAHRRLTSSVTGSSSTNKTRILERCLRTGNYERRILNYDAPMMCASRSVVLAFSCLLLSGCFGSRGAERHVDVALGDGTHVGGQLVSVEPDWFVLDRTLTDEPDIMLVDYSLIDTVTIFEEMSTGQQAGISLLGGGVGGLAGYWIGEGYIPDSTRPADPRKSTRATIGAVAGVALGGLVSYFIAREVGSNTIVFDNPSDEDYDSISTYAKYPTGLPADLRMALDSGWGWTSDKN